MSKSARGPSKSMRLILLAAAMLVSASLACTFELNSKEPTPNETDIARSVEETLQAEQSYTEEARLPDETTEPPAVEATSPTLNETIQAQQATLDAQATSLVQPSVTPPTAQDTPAATVTAPASSSEPISLVDMKPLEMRQAPGCGEDRNGPPCWFGRGAELELMLQKPLLIDPAWQNPHLTFSHRYVFIQNATIYVKADGGWNVLWSFPSGQSSLWVPFKVDLKKYQGKEILIHFTVSGSTGTLFGPGRTNEWYIRDPKIVPNYQP